MKPRIIGQLLTGRRLLGGLGVLALVLLGSGTSRQADAATGAALMHLTFSQAVSLPGAVLPAGEYRFEALRPDIVRVSSRDGRRVLYTGFTHSVRRPDGLARDVFVAVGEAPVGDPLPITRWYPENRARGHQFIW